jgi:hypothetical protein
MYLFTISSPHIYFIIQANIGNTHIDFEINDNLDED